MLAARLFGRTFLAAAKSESSAAAAAASSATAKTLNPLEQFFEVDRTPEDDKPVVYVRASISRASDDFRFLNWVSGISISRNTKLLLGYPKVSPMKIESMLCSTWAGLPSIWWKDPSIHGFKDKSSAMLLRFVTGVCTFVILSSLIDKLLYSRAVERAKKRGRGWKASELRLKSWDDLQKLWYVLLKEKNMLMTQRQMLNAQNLRFPNPERISKVRKSMCRIKHVLTERAIDEADPRRSAEMKRMINAL
ncbi:hypothetical protein HAX54_032884 [Datura stramonium]|uniref:Large ribosomal subunit protein uL29m n=1 Tax=Datura stramonium TaxID=4076 RepID=A0ABS8RLM6_DATST|nr:hypothetical protein [Datura stramonium]